MKVRMWPSSMDFEGGIKTVVNAYKNHLPNFGVSFTDSTDFDAEMVHAGTSSFTNPGGPNLAVCHGLYWGDDREPSGWEIKANRNVIQSLRYARAITTPSEWVAQVIRRDMHVSPFVVPHGIDWDDWQHNEEDEGYVLSYYKNRVGGVCDPRWSARLAMKYRGILFKATFSANPITKNMKVTGVVPHEEMRLMMQRSSVCVSTTKETFGLLILEAMAAGKPVLAFDNGGASDLIQHGVNGYLAKWGNFDDLATGLEYCLDNKEVLGSNGRELAKKYSWENSCAKLMEAVEYASRIPERNVSIVVPAFNREDTLERAVMSAVNQSGDLVKEVIIVNDGSTDSSGEIADKLASSSNLISVIHQENGKVAKARNTGIEASTSEYVVCLDADDAIDTRFVQTCLPTLTDDNSLGITYTGLLSVTDDGETPSSWPPDFDFNNQLRKQNQVPTCCVFKKEAWRRLGGYRSRYCPRGGGSEDAEFWTRIGSVGFSAKKVTAEPLFMYTLGKGETSRHGYSEIYWLDKPWVKDGIHPFASVAKPENGFSHKVHQYDKPTISVIIPVGPSHLELLWDALDSVERQTFRKWEIVVVNDSGRNLDGRILGAFPFVRFVNTTGEVGAGAARNIGVDNSYGDLIIFLDADDQLLPDALMSMYEEYLATGYAVYGNYRGLQITDSVEVSDNDTVMSYDEATKQLVTKSVLMGYDCASAMVQPRVVGNVLRPYMWCCVVTLFPKSWHYEIGGFDEKMPAWEDWLYFLNMARNGRCFSKIDQETFIYNYTAGRRRAYAQVGDDDEDRVSHLVGYMKRNLAEDKTMGCSGCGKKKNIFQGVDASGDGDASYRLALYASPNRGKHPVVGRGTKNVIRRYGYRSGGQHFLVHVDDIRSQPHLFKCPNGDDFVFRSGVPMCMDEEVARQRAIEPPPPPEPIQIVEPVAESASDNAREVVAEPDRAGDEDADCSDIIGELVSVKYVGPKLALTLCNAGCTGIQDLVDRWDVLSSSINKLSRGKVKHELDNI